MLIAINSAPAPQWITPAHHRKSESALQWTGMIRSCGEQVKQYGERRLPTAGVLSVLLAHQVHQFDPARDCVSAAHGLEPEHRPDPPLDRTMILLDAIIQVYASR
jgi:hypothetical protein